MYVIIIVYLYVRWLLVLAAITRPVFTVYVIIIVYLYVRWLLVLAGIPSPIFTVATLYSY